MTSQPLPERANLEQLKKQAKSLLSRARERDAASLERFRILPISSPGLALHDAQCVIAREYGFKSWNELKEAVEEQSLTFSAAVDEFLRCSTGSAPARALRLLAKHPGIGHANLYTELVLGDVEAVRGRLQSHPDVVKQRGGIQEWEPLLYVCHTCTHHDVPLRADGLVAVARELLALGANPNAEYHWSWHKELPRTALWGALCAVNHLPLAEVLLENGANSTDGVSLHINAGGGNIPQLELLHRFGVNVNGIPGGVPPLRYMLGWAGGPTERAVGVQWLLDHGADPNLQWSEFGDGPLHVAAERWDVKMVELLVRHGGDIHRRRRDGRTPLTLAELHGNQEIAAWLRAHGAKDELSPLERFVAAATRGDRASAEAMLKEQPSLRAELTKEHHLLMQVPAERGDASVLETMLMCGFDPNVPDHDGVVALHRASMGGKPDAVRVLLAHGAAVNAMDGMFSATPLVWASEGWQHTSDPQEGYLEVAGVLLAAGSSREWSAPPNAPDPERGHDKLAELIRVATALP